MTFFRRMTTAGLLFAGLLFVSPLVASAEPVYLCERPDQSLTVTYIVKPPAEDVLRKLRRDGMLPSPTDCWWHDSSLLPLKGRPDPHAAGQTISQRHRWRRVGQAVIVDATVKRPQGEAIRREYGRLFPPARWAEIVATPLGSALDRAIRENRWADASAALAQTGATQPLTVAEIARLRAILSDYQAD